MTTIAILALWSIAGYLIADEVDDPRAWWRRLLLLAICGPLLWAMAAVAWIASLIQDEP